MSASTPNRPSIQEIYERQGEALKHASREEWELSLATCREALTINDRDTDAYVKAARCYRKLGKHKTAIDALKQALSKCAPSLRLYGSYIRLLEECNCTKEARAVAHEATLEFPGDIWLKLKEALLLPILYDTEDEVAFFRRRFEEGLQKIHQTISLDTPES